MNESDLTPVHGIFTIYVKVDEIDARRFFKTLLYKPQGRFFV